jgi:hypothetical protein
MERANPLVQPMAAPVGPEEAEQLQRAAFARVGERRGGGHHSAEFWQRRVVAAARPRSQPYRCKGTLNLSGPFSRSA